MNRREILFRGKRLDGTWAEGYYVFNEETHGIVDSRVFPGSWSEVDPSTIGQFTGLTDKNGVKIWEGDKVKYKCCRQGEESQFYEQNDIIKFRMGCFCVGSTPLGDWNWSGESIQNAKITYRNHVHDMGHGADKIYYKDFDMEIIGTIHDTHLTKQS